LDPSRFVNPYIAGSPVSGTEMFFGREDVFSFVRRNLIGQHRDTPIVLYGQRRTGKTSVLYQLHRHLDPRYRCIFIDLHGLSLDGMGNLMWGIASYIRRGLKRDHQLSVGIPDRATFFADPRSAFETEFLDAVWEVLGEDHLVLMMDEVVRLDEEVRAGRLEREVFDYLRHLMQHFARLNFIFSLGSGLEEMEKDYAFLFSVSLYRRISFLEPAAGRALITQPVRDYYQVMEEAVQRILQITSGHPYYTQLVCHCMCDRWSRSPKSAMTAADVDAVLAEAVELGSANLTYVWEDSTPEEQAMMAGMAAAMHGNRAVTVDHVRKAWRKVSVSLPEGEVARAVRSLTAREVVAGERTYSFAVDLQRLWLEKHRRLDWVKEELAAAVREWDRSATPTDPAPAVAAAADGSSARLVAESAAAPSPPRLGAPSSGPMVTGTSARRPDAAQPSTASATDARTGGAGGAAWTIITHRGHRWPIAAGLLALVVLCGAAMALIFMWPSQPLGPQEAQSLNRLLEQSSRDRTDSVGAVADIENCGDLRQDQTTLGSSAQSRQTLLHQLSRLKLPNSTHLVSALTVAWKASIGADESYAAWAGDLATRRCVGHASVNDPNYQKAGGYDGQATAAKRQFASAWKPIAVSYGLPQYGQSNI
jgi:hypothetical protein